MARPICAGPNGTEYFHVGSLCDHLVTDRRASRGTLDWHAHFRIPGIVLLLTVPLWLTIERLCPETGELQQTTVQRSYRQIFTYLWREKVTVYCGVSVLLLTLMTLLSCLIGPVISSYIPLDYTADSMSAPISGILDAMVYLGGSISTYVLGFLAADGRLTGAAWYWAAAAAAGMALSAVAMRRVRQKLPA